MANLCECGIDLDEVAASNKLGHLCTKAQTTTRDYITVYTTSSVDGPSLDLMHGKKQRIVVFAQLAEPQPENLPPGLVAIVLPSNCYIDTFGE